MSRRGQGRRGCRVGLPVLARYGGDVLWIAAGLIGIPLWIGMAVLARRMR